MAAGLRQVSDAKTTSVPHQHLDQAMHACTSVDESGARIFGQEYLEDHVAFVGD